jgi:lysophospholipase L1-like esterase
MEIFDIATMGTSLTANWVSYIEGQWQELLQRALTPGKSSRSRVYNVGAGGVTSAYGLANIDRVLRYRPKAVTIEYNMNDCATANSISTAQSQSNHVAIINAIKDALPDAAIFLMTMNPPIGSAVSARPNIESYNDVYRALAASLEGVEIIDTAPSWAGATTALIPDDIHPNLAAWKSKLIPAMTTAIAPFVE